MYAASDDAASSAKRFTASVHRATSIRSASANLPRSPDYGVQGMALDSSYRTASRHSGRRSSADAVNEALATGLPLGFTRVGPLMALPAWVKERGVRLETLLAQNAIDPTIFEDHDSPISYVAASRLLRDCACVTNCSQIGLQLGLRAPIYTLGPLGYLLLTSATLGHALKDLVSYFGAHDRGGVVHLSVHEEIASLSYAIVEPGVVEPRNVHLLAIMVGVNLLRALLGLRWRPLRVDLSCRRQDAANVYERAFGSAVRFDAPQSAIHFEASILRRALPSADAILNRLMRQRVEVDTISVPRDLLASLRLVLRITLASSAASLPAVASRLGMSVKALERILHAHGTTFRQQREVTLREVSQELLTRTQLSIGEIAAAIGYKEHAAFARAFRNWTGMSPSRWRELRS